MFSQMHSLEKNIAKQADTTYIFSSSMDALASLIKCNRCDAGLMQSRGKGGGYYGCCNAKCCGNDLLLNRERIEGIILKDLKEKFLTKESVRCIYDHARKSLGRVLNEGKGNYREGTLEALEATIKNIYGSFELAEEVESKDKVEVCRSFYVAHTSIQTLALLVEEPKGTDWMKLWMIYKALTRLCKFLWAPLADRAPLDVILFRRKAYSSRSCEIKLRLRGSLKRDRPIKTCKVEVK